jgi:hypothetical protein
MWPSWASRGTLYANHACMRAPHCPASSCALLTPAHLRGTQVTSDQTERFFDSDVADGQEGVPLTLVLTAVDTANGGAPGEHPPRTSFSCAA